MKWTRTLAALFAIGFVLASDHAASAAWNNVFQVTCHRCWRSSPSTSNYIAYAAPLEPSCCDPCQTCTTRMVQRTYYQQVTHYENRTYYQPVTTYRTSYYWEPVVSYRYTSYYDPSTCCYRQQACPVTSYRLRSQCCPVQSFVARCVSVPVTSLKPVCYYEPQTTCTPSGGTAIPPQSGLGGNPPGVDEQRTPGTGTGESRGSDRLSPYESNRPGYPDYMPPVQGLLNRQAPQQSPAPPRAIDRATEPKVTLERIAAAPSTRVEGDVTATQKDGVRVLFKNADREGVSQYATSDAKGHFEAHLAKGNWLVYTHDSNSRPVLQAKLVVTEKESRPIKLTGN